MKRTTPTLINAGLQPFLFYGMRVSFLEDQAAEVIKNKDEMHGEFIETASKLCVLRKNIAIGVLQEAIVKSDK